MAHTILILNHFIPSLLYTIDLIMKKFAFGCIFGSMTTFVGFKIYSKINPESGVETNDRHMI